MTSIRYSVNYSESASLSPLTAISNFSTDRQQSKQRTFTHNSFDRYQHLSANAIGKANNMAATTQFACTLLTRPDNNGWTIDVAIDRTLKGIGVFNAATAYESLPGFEKYAAST